MLGVTRLTTLVSVQVRHLTLRVDPGSRVGPLAFSGYFAGVHVAMKGSWR